MAAAIPAMTPVAEQPSALNPSILSFFQPAAPVTDAEGLKAQPGLAATPPMVNPKQFVFSATGTHRADAFSPETGKVSGPLGAVSQYVASFLFGFC